MVLENPRGVPTRQSVEIDLVSEIGPDLTCSCLKTVKCFLCLRVADVQLTSCRLAPRPNRQAHFKSGSPDRKPVPIVNTWLPYAAKLRSRAPSKLRPELLPETLRVCH